MYMLQCLFYLTTAVHVSGVTITHFQEHKTTVTTASGNNTGTYITHYAIEIIVFSAEYTLFSRLRWSRGSVLAFGNPSSRVQTRPKPSDF